MINFNIELPEFINNTLSKPAQAVGNTLTNTWELVFGGFDFYVQKIQHKRQQNFYTFKQEVEGRIANVPPENLIEPPLHILGPTLEASKYYFDNEELRTMFAKLIAATINIDTINNAHPSFTEVIKQLSPIDAQNLKNIGFITKPIGKYICKIQGGTYSTLKTNIFLESENDIHTNAASLTNLSRLGLVQISYENRVKDASVYEKFKLTSLFSYFTEQIKIIPNATEVTLEEGIVSLTPYGEDFYKTCIV